MEINNRYVCHALYKMTGEEFWATAHGGWSKDSNRAHIFTSSGAGGRVNSMNKNANWRATKVPVSIKVLTNANK